MLINVKMLTIVRILTFISWTNTTYERLNANESLFIDIYLLRAVEISCSVEMSINCF